MSSACSWLEMSSFCSFFPSKAVSHASNSSARGVANHTRNVPDDVLKRVATNGGVIMINFYPSFLDERTNRE